MPDALLDNEVTNVERPKKSPGGLTPSVRRAARKEGGYIAGRTLDPPAT